MFKKVNGYFTVEASFVMPVVLLLYLAILSASLHLYRRCVVSQDVFLLSLRASCFTWAEENYGEVIYNDREMSSWKMETYVDDRWSRKYSGEEVRILCVKDANWIWLQANDGNILETIEKRIKILNPVMYIRERRKNADA